MSLPFCSCSCWVCNLHSAVRDRVWIFWALLLHTQQSKPNHGICSEMPRGYHLSESWLCSHCTPMLRLHPGTCLSVRMTDRAPTLWKPDLYHVPYLWWKIVPVVLPLSSSSFPFQPNLLLWVSARGVLSPSVSNSCWGQGGIERLNESLQHPERIPHASLPLAPASVFDPPCFPTQSSPSGCDGFLHMPTYRAL